jgi:hypothetical protein
VGLPPHKKSPHPINNKRFTREFYFMSYMPLNVIFLNNFKDLNITTFTKICTNYVEDWEENVQLEYQPQAGYNANPYGMVAYISGALFGGVKEYYVYHPEQFPQDIWEVKIEGTNKYVIPKMNIEDLKQILSEGNNSAGELLISSPFDSTEIHTADCLSIIYQHLNLEELNILASHRDKFKSIDCLDYVHGAWAKLFNEILSSIEKESSDLDIERLIKCASLCEQIEAKTYFVVNGVPKLLKKLKDIAPKVDSEEKWAGAILDKMYKKILGKAPLFGNEEYENYFTDLRAKYTRYRTEICPLTKALLEVACDNFGHKNLINIERKQEEIKNAIKIIPFDKKKNVMMVEYEEKNITKDIKSIRKDFERLVKSDKIFILNKNINSINFDVNDGRGNPS